MPNGGGPPRSLWTPAVVNIVDQARVVMEAQKHLDRDNPLLGTRQNDVNNVCNAVRGLYPLFDVFDHL